MHVSELDYAVLSFLGEHPGEITVSDLAARIEALLPREA